MAQKVKIMQKNWIGKSVGCELNFEIKNDNNKITVFTTRPDTIFGASFIALAVDHPLSKKYENDEKYLDFKEACYKTGNTDEAIAKTEKIGFKTDFEVLHPFIKLKLYQSSFQILFLWNMEQVQFLAVLHMIREI